MRPVALVMSFSLLAAAAAAAEAQPAAVTRRPKALDRLMELHLQVKPAAPKRASGGRKLGQIVAGGAGAFAGGVLGYIGFHRFSQQRVSGDAGYYPSGNVGWSVGSWLGAATTAHLVGRGDGSRAPFAATLVGAAVPTLPMLLSPHDPYVPLWGTVFGAPLQGMGATLGYQIGRTP